MRIVVAIAALGLLAGGVAQAQTALPPAGSVGSTIDGAPPERAASTTAVGQTKPPGTAAPGTNPRLDQESRNLDKRIRNGICQGCD